MTKPGLPDHFYRLRAATPARIGLGRQGDALPLDHQLDLQEAHARARDAVHRQLDVALLTAQFQPHDAIVVRSAAADRASFLRRPDLGRVLALPASEIFPKTQPSDLVFVIADGLSADAVMAHAAKVVALTRPLLGKLSVGPLVVAEQARVALGDDIGERLNAKMVAVLIGERPGLSVSDSLGIYLTASPRPGRRDSERNCISNIHSRGLTHQQAARQLASLVHAARVLGETGIALKPIAGSSGGLLDGE